MGEIMRNRKSAFPFAVTIEMLSAVVRSPSSSSICMSVWTIWLQVLEHLENVKAAPIAHTLMGDLVPISITAHALAIAYMSTQQSHETASEYINTIQLIKCRLKSKRSFRRTKCGLAVFSKQSNQTPTSMLLRLGKVRSSHIPARHGWSHTSCDCWRVWTEFKERIDRFATESKTKKRWWKEKKGINVLRIRFCSGLCSSSILYSIYSLPFAPLPFSFCAKSTPGKSPRVASISYQASIYNHIYHTVYVYWQYWVSKIHFRIYKAGRGQLDPKPWQYKQLMATPLHSRFCQSSLNSCQRMFLLVCVYMICSMCQCILYTGQTWGHPVLARIAEKHTKRIDKFSSY